MNMPLRCLIVDDSARFLQAARILLEREGCSVDIASSGAEALIRSQVLHPDVVLLDIHLGQESGFDVARSLVARLNGDSPRIILISTHAEEDFADLLADCPVVGFLSKAALSVHAIQDLLEGAAC